jgi:hypothetical protein
MEERTPPKVPLVLRIGVTGHRPDSDKRPSVSENEIRKTTAEILQIIQNSFSGIADTYSDLFLNQGESKGTLRIISCLAEGADQWVTEEALQKGFELQCILPFDRQEYLKDFKNSSNNCFKIYQHLLTKASAIFELDGTRTPSNKSYEAAGRALLRQTDILIAVWDGQPAKGIGGTGQIVKEALLNDIPVIWIPWTSKGDWKIQFPGWEILKESGDEKNDTSDLEKLIPSLLLPLRNDETHRKDYFREKQKYGNPQIGIWTLFISFITGKLFSLSELKNLIRLNHFRIKDFEETCVSHSNNLWEYKTSEKINSTGNAENKKMDHPFSDTIKQWVDSKYIPHYAWANGLSMYYGTLFRSAFIISYFLAAIAVFFALFCFANNLTLNAKNNFEAGWITAELIIILGILLITKRGNRRRWHQRWIDYRTLAESLRIARCLSLQGGGSPKIFHSGHLGSYVNPTQTWMHWHLKAIERAAGLTNINNDIGFLESIKEFWKESLIIDQRWYHIINEKKSKQIDSRLHKSGDFLFIATLIACAFHLIGLWFFESYSVYAKSSGWLTLICAFLPAMGASFAAIRNHSEAQRMAQRSKAMNEAMEQLQLKLSTINCIGNNLNSQLIRKVSDQISELMTRELLDWRVVFIDRPLGLPT